MLVGAGIAKLADALVRAVQWPAAALAVHRLQLQLPDLMVTGVGEPDAFLPPSIQLAR